MSRPRLSLIPAVLAFCRCRWLQRRLRTRADLERYQQARLQRWLKADVPKVSAYAKGRVSTLGDLPVIAKPQLMGAFEDYNRLKLTAEAGWAHFAAKTQPDGFHIGASTGTSGNRGLYVISDAERAAWLGTMLAKALPGFPFERARVAILLAQDAALYRQPGRGGRLALSFFDLKDGLAGLPDKLEAYRPDTIVAPPKVLRHLAGLLRSYPVRHLFSGAEVMDPTDREAIRAGFGLEPGEIYMATEGLFAVTCSHRRLHLTEDVMHFEFEPGPEGSGLVTPVISDFSRKTQIMARYRMNDLLRLSDEPCACGSPLKVVREVVGRADDLLAFPSSAGGSVIVTPDVIRNVVLDASRDIQDFRAEQTAANRLLVLLPEHLPQVTVEAVRLALHMLFARLQITPDLVIEQRRLDPPLEKLRRVRRTFAGGA